MVWEAWCLRHQFCFLMLTCWSTLCSSRLIDVFGSGVPCADMGGCQNYGPFLDPYYNMAGTQKGTIILTTNPLNPKL